MKKSSKFIIACMTALLFIALLSACGDITNQDPKAWPKKGPAASVPKPEAGEITLAVTKEDVDGKAFSIITVSNFTADDMGDYIRLLLSKDFETFVAQTISGNYITYSAKKGDRLVSLRLNTDENKMTIQID